MTGSRQVAFLFPGQGSQYPRMAAGLYGAVDVFTETMDRAFDLLGDDGAALRHDWLSDSPGDRYDNVTVAQPLLYAVECALGRMVLDWGVRPAALLGHSVGEMVAATLAGVLDFDDGVRLMVDRIEHYAASPPGGMLAVSASAADITPFLSGTLAVAAVNAEQQTMIAGGRTELAELAETLRSNRLTCITVRAKQAFHSPVVADAAAATIAGWRTVSLSPPRVPIYSAYLGSVLDPETAVDPVFWALQPARPVLFWPTLDALLRDRKLLLAEIGPGRGLTTLARRHPAVRTGDVEVLNLLPVRAGTRNSELDGARRAADRFASDGHMRHAAVIAP
ncbi:acyltransferase domain-containing protein [Streptomyces sp. NPDC050535]|uniref:acyltransferase domain-containing protein n=1 Tax=Streptomyces sp. NPDC050535 TaxID=3365626 RepID=UPI0037A36D28